jgi:SRSO17 transposase
VAFATKPQLVRAMIAHAVRAGVLFKWAAGDGACGGNPGLREWLETEKNPYVLAVACNAIIETKAGAKRADELEHAGVVVEGLAHRDRRGGGLTAD